MDEEGRYQTCRRSESDSSNDDDDRPGVVLRSFWKNPWSTTKDYAKSAYFAALASIPNWDWATPEQGFDREQVIKTRKESGARYVLASFGGSTATTLWKEMASNPVKYARKMVKFLDKLGLDGVDYDYITGISYEVSVGLLEMMREVKSLRREGVIIQTMSCLAGSYSEYKPIILARDVLDKIMVMCGNAQGMFVRGNIDIKDWRGWMWTWSDSVPKSQISKLTIGMIVNHSRYSANERIVKQAVKLCLGNNWAGIAFWWYSDDAAPETVTRLMRAIPSDEYGDEALYKKRDLRI